MNRHIKTRVSVLTNNDAKVAILTFIGISNKQENVFNYDTANSLLLTKLPLRHAR